jgi:hypothetical protein
MQPHAPFKTAGSAEISTVDEDARREPGAAGVVRFLLRFTEMWISMLLGMAVFRYVRLALANHGYTAFLEPMSVASEVGNGVFMIAPMMLWMRIRGCRWRDNLEMAVAMLLPWAAVLVLGRRSFPGSRHAQPCFSACWPSCCIAGTGTPVAIPSTGATMPWSLSECNHLIRPRTNKTIH